MLALASEAVTAAYVLATKKPVPVSKEKEAPMAFSAGGEKSGAKPAPKGGVTREKEL